MNKKTEINKIFTNYDYMPFGRKCQGNGAKQGKKIDFFLDFFIGRDILRDGNSMFPPNFIQLRLLWRMRDPAQGRVGHAFLFAEQGNPVRNRNTAGMFFSCCAVSMEGVLFPRKRVTGATWEGEGRPLRSFLWTCESEDLQNEETCPKGAGVFSAF